MILSEGKNQYPNHKFSFWEWSAPVLQKPEEVMEKIRELRLVGRVVRDIRAVGMGYGWSWNDPDDLIPRAARYAGKERLYSGLRLPLPNRYRFERSVQIDEPILIAFEDGDILGIDFSEGSSVRMDLNTIPWDIQPGTNQKNFHANRLFADLIGKPITAVELSVSTAEPNFTGSFGLDLQEQAAYIHQVALRYSQGILGFSPFFDYGDVELLHPTGEAQMLTCTQALYVVEGFFRPEEV